MRFLYGDSEPFPLDYDFLQTLERFVEHGVVAAHHDALITRIEKAAIRRSRDTARSRELLETFTDEICQGVSDARTLAPADPALIAYADRVVLFAEQAAKDALAQDEERTTRALAKASEDRESHREKMREELNEFLLNGVLGGELVHATLTMQSPGGYAIDATRRLTGGLEVTYRIDTERFKAWTEPRTVESVAGAMEIQIGMKKKFLRSDMTRELMRVGDHTITRVLMDESTAEITIKKKPESPKPPLTLMLSREGEELDAFIERTDKDLFPAVPSDAEKISGLWEALQSVAQRALDFRDAVVAVRYADEDLLNGAGLHALIGVLMEAYAPIAREIDRRSPSSRELSLKLEHEGGRREEIYLSKEKLRAVLDGKDETAQQRFSQLPLQDRGSRLPPPPPPLKR
mgnify:CR=1 FL=1